jgi:hypothetical protein
MSRSLVCTGLLAAAALFVLVTADVSGLHIVSGAWADTSNGQANRPRRAKRQARGQERGYTLSQGSTPEEIARYFQLYGGYIDPTINKQSPGGPFDSGFFFDSGMGQNGGDSPYMQ